MEFGKQVHWDKKFEEMCLPFGFDAYSLHKQFDVLNERFEYGANWYN